MNENPSKAAAKFGLTERLCLLVIVLACALAMSPNVADPDLWGHVQFGRDVLNTGEIAKTTSYSYTAEGYRWINHENASEIVMAVIVDSIGPFGLVFGKFCLSLLVILTIVRWNLKHGVGFVATGVIALLVAANLGYHWSLRPQLSSFVCYTVLICLLNYCFSGWQGRWNFRWPKSWFIDSNITESKTGVLDQPRESLGYSSHRLRLLWLAPLIFLVWANSHGGFVAGLCVFAAYLGCRALEALQRCGWAGWGIVRRMVLMGTVAVLATLINPYGPKLHLWLLESLGNPRPEISDWSNRELLSLIGMKFWGLLAVSGFALFLSRRRWDATQVLLLTLTLWQSISHFRHVPFFAILVGFWLGPHLQSAFERIRLSSQQAASESKLGVVAIQCCLLVSSCVITWRLADRLTEVRVYRDEFPVDAIAFMRDNQLHGRTVVTYDWAQYVIAAMCSDEWNNGQQSRVAFDGRFRTCYPQTVVDMHFDFLYGHSTRMQRHRSEESPSVDPSRVLAHMQPEIVLLRRKGELTEHHMHLNEDQWTLLYQDGIAQVWGAKHVYDDKNLDTFISPERRRIHDRSFTSSVAWPAIFPPRELHPVQPVSFSKEQSRQDD